MIYWHGRTVLVVAACLLIADAGHFARAESIAEAIAAAYSTNPRINAERARQRADGEKLPQARAGFLPTISGTLDRGKDELRDTHLATIERARNTVYGATLSQPLFDGFRTYNDVQRANAEITAGRETLDAVSTDVLLLATEAYVNVIRDRKVEALRREAITVYKSQLEQAEKRFIGGDLTRTGVDQARTRLLEAEGEFAQARADLAASEALYRAVIGHDPGSLTRPLLVASALPQSLEMAMKIAESQNARLRAAYYNFLAARYAVSVARGALAPTVSLDASTYRTRGLTTDNTEPNGTSVRVKLAIQLFNGGRDLSRISQAVDVKDQRHLEVDDARATMRKVVESAWYAIEGAKMRLVASSGRIAAAQAALRGLLIEFQAGQTPIIYVLDGRREVINAQVARVIAERDHFYQSIVVMAALGQLSLDRPGLVSGIVQSERPPRDRLVQSQVPLDRNGPRTKKPSGEQTTADRGHADPWRGIAASVEAGPSNKDNARSSAVPTNLAQSKDRAPLDVTVK
jgi:outer membrane protein